VWGGSHGYRAPPLPQRQPRERKGVQPVERPEEVQDPSPEVHMEVMPEEQGGQE